MQARAREAIAIMSQEEAFIDHWTAALKVPVQSHARVLTTLLLQPISPPSDADNDDDAAYQQADLHEFSAPLPGAPGEPLQPQLFLFASDIAEK
jgi:hypothetical protein